MSQPRPSILRHLISVLSRMVGRDDPAEAIAYEEAARTAFQAGTLLHAPRDVAPPSTADSRERPPAQPLGSVSGRSRLQAGSSATRAASSVSAPRGESIEWHTAPAEEPAAEVRRPDQDVPRVGRPAPDLLRTPRSVAPVADDFFDGLIRRVERDR